jgi:hypothetical protein
MLPKVAPIKSKPHSAGESTRRKSFIALVLRIISVTQEGQVMANVFFFNKTNKTKMGHMGGNSRVGTTVNAQNIYHVHSRAFLLKYPSIL